MIPITTIPKITTAVAKKSEALRTICPTAIFTATSSAAS